MKKSQVPPNWAKLVEKSSEHITDEDYNLAKMWLLPDADLGDIAMQTNSRTHAGPSGNNVHTALPSGHHILLQEVDFSRSNDAPVISQEDSIPRPYLDSVIDSLPSVQDDHSVPPLINLETSGLQQSPRLAALQHNNDALAIVTYTTSTIPISSRLFTKPRPRLLFLLVFNLVGSLWTFATTSSHMDNETFSFVDSFLNDYDHLNGFLDDTINDICHQVHASATSNEAFRYSQMLREEDHKHFLKQWKLNLPTTNFATIGLSWNARTYLLEQR
jgi:hypothetical protein